MTPKARRIYLQLVRSIRAHVGRYGIPGMPMSWYEMDRRGKPVCTVTVMPGADGVIECVVGLMDGSRSWRFKIRAESSKDWCPKEPKRGRKVKR